MELTVSKEVIDWCNQQVDKGKELKFTWEGGGDSGWASLVLNGKEVSNDYSNQLLDGIYEELDYGSWAGEFFSSGEAIYNKEDQSFTGIDDYQEEESFPNYCDIVLRIPDKLWYDSIEVRIESDGEEIHDDAVSVRFVIKNGFISDEHGYYAEALEKQILGEVRQEVDKFINDGGEFRSVWQTIVLERKDSEQVPDYIQHKIDCIMIGTMTNDEKYIELNLTQDDEQD